MDFYALLDQVVDLLRSRQRVTYRTLKRQFDLDDAALEDLKEELLFDHPQIADEDGRGLVWTPDTEPAPASLPPLQPIGAMYSRSSSSALSSAALMSLLVKWRYFLISSSALRSRAAGSMRRNPPRADSLWMRASSGNPRPLV